MHEMSDSSNGRNELVYNTLITMDNVIVWEKFCSIHLTVGSIGSLAPNKWINDEVLNSFGTLFNLREYDMQQNTPHHIPS